MPRARGVPHGRRGVSEVVGALVLILVVVIAVAAIAFFVATSEQQAFERTQFQSSVANENLSIVQVNPFPSDSSIEYMLVSTTNSSDTDYVQYVNASSVNLSLDGASQGYSVIGGRYNMLEPMILSGLPVGVDRLAHTVDISDSSGSPYFVRFASWRYLLIEIKNLDIANSGVWRISVNGYYVNFWYDVEGDPANPTLTLYNNALPPLVIPAKEMKTVLVNITGFFPADVPVLRTDALQILVVSPTGNFFSKTLGAPLALMSVSRDTESYGISSRDVYHFDASQSSPDTILDYIWRIDVPQKGWTLNDWNDLSNITTLYVHGSVIQYRPELLLSSLTGLNVTGPLRVSLMVVDQSGLVGYSGQEVLASDPDIVPLGGLTVSTTPAGPSAYNVSASVTDIFGRPVAGAVVFFEASGAGLSSILPAYASTDSTGLAVSTVTLNGLGSVVATVKCADLPPVQLVLP